MGCHVRPSMALRGLIVLTLAIGLSFPPAGAMAEEGPEKARAVRGLQAAWLRLRLLLARHRARQPQRVEVPPTPARPPAATPTPPPPEPMTPGTVSMSGARIELACHAPQQALEGDRYVQRVVVRNTGKEVCRELTVELQFSQPVEVVRTNHPVQEEPQQLTWLVDRLDPGEQRELAVEVVPLQPGPLRCQARAVAAAVAETVTLVRAVRLAAQIEGPPQLVRGQKTVLKLRVRNEGEIPATNVAIRRVVDGVQTASAESTPAFRLKLGDLAPGEEKVVPIPVLVMAERSVQLRLEVQTDQGARAEAVYQARVLAPTLDVQVQSDRWIVGRTGQMKVVVANRGPLPAEETELLVYVGSLIEPQTMPSAVYRAELRTVQVPLGRLEPGQQRVVELPLQPLRAGRHLVRLCAVATNAEVRKLDYVLDAVGVAVLNAEINEGADPVAPGEAVSYEVVLRNSGSAVASDVQVEIRWSGGLRVQQVMGPASAQLETGTARLIIGQVAPGKTLRWRIQGMVQGREPIRIHVRAISPSVPIPAEDTETTVVLP